MRILIQKRKNSKIIIAINTDENAEIINKAKEEYNIEIVAFWAGWSGPAIWNSYDGPATLGLVPEAYRHKRFEELKKGADFAEKLGLEDDVYNEKTVYYTSELEDLNKSLVRKLK